jgi:hypothetical protein
MHALKVASDSKWSRRPPKSEQLRIMYEESARIRAEHTAGKLSAEEASRQLSELKTRYAGILDSLLAI